MTEFQHGLCGCFDNCGLCILTAFLPCYTVGKTAEAVGSSCCLCGLGYIFGLCIVGGILREKVRNQKGINGSLCVDILTHWFCSFCAVIQDNQEVVGSSAMALSIARVWRHHHQHSFHRHQHFLLIYALNFLFVIETRLRITLNKACSTTHQQLKNRTTGVEAITNQQGVVVWYAWLHVFAWALLLFRSYDLPNNTYALCHDKLTNANCCRFWQKNSIWINSCAFYWVFLNLNSIQPYVIRHSTYRHDLALILVGTKPV